MRGRRLCARAFPRAWRERYESELLALLAEEDRPAGAQCVDLLWAGTRVRAGSLRLPAVARPVGVLGSAALAAVSVAAVMIGPARTAPARHRPVTVRVSRPIVADGGTQVHRPGRPRRSRREVVRIVRLRSTGPVPGRATGEVLTHGAGS